MQACGCARRKETLLAPSEWTPSQRVYVQTGGRVNKQRRRCARGRCRHPEEADDAVCAREHKT